MGQMGGVPVMAPQPMMYNQPVLRPTNPFAPMPGAQVSYPVLVHSYAHSDTFATEKVFNSDLFSFLVSSERTSERRRFALLSVRSSWLILTFQRPNQHIYYA